MAMQPFTDNYEDNSTDAGFQFTFFCDVCREGYKSRFVESKTFRKAGLFKKLGEAISIGTSILGKGNIGYEVRRGTDILSERFHGMSPEWHKEHETAFSEVQNEAKGHFQRCPRCKRWVCENDWNEQGGLCVEDAPRQNVEIAAARAERIKDEIREKAGQANLFHGEIEAKQTLCPQCNKPTGEGKFCNSCGATLAMNKCPRCGASNSAASRFCGECGNKF